MTTHINVRLPLVLNEKSSRLKDKNNRRPNLQLATTDDGKETLKPDKATEDTFGEGLMHCFGAIDADVINFQLNLLTSLFSKTYGSKDAHNYVLAMLNGIAPENEVEGMLAVQMVATQYTSLTLLLRCHNGENSVDVNNMLFARATKAQGMFLRQMEALQKLRQGGQTIQKVIVEKVNVEAGGQAIVGAVTQGGGGSKPKSEE